MWHYLKWVYARKAWVVEKWPKCLFFSSKHTSVWENKNFFFLAMHQANIFHDSISLMFSVQVAWGNATKHCEGFLSRTGRWQQDPMPLKGRLPSATKKLVRFLVNHLSWPRVLLLLYEVKERLGFWRSWLRSLPNLAFGSRTHLGLVSAFQFPGPGRKVPLSWISGFAHMPQKSLDRGNRKSCSKWRGDVLCSPQHGI